MKNLSFSLFLMLAFGTFATAQSSFVLSSDTVIGTVEIPEISAPGPSTVTNLLSTSLNINWTRFILNISPGCVIQVCDPNNCYLPEVNSKNFTLQGNGVGNMMVDLVDTTFSEQPKSALVRVKYSNLGQSSDTASTYYFLSITGISGTTNQSAALRVALYPNPVSESFTLDNAEVVHNVRVYNLGGRQVAAYTATPGQRYSLANQPAGTYIVALADTDGHIFRALEVVKE